MAKNRPLIGRVLKDTYTIERVIGKGGMGVVYEASHLRLNRRFAIKVLQPEVADNPKAIARIRREANITSSLHHPHILEVIDFNHIEDKIPYIVMELLEGEDLAQRIRRRIKLEIDEIASIFEQTASALSAAHQLGVIHRDLKPQNIFLCNLGDQTDYVKVLDFGISKILGSPSTMSASHPLLGSPFYMAPEQVEEKHSEIDQRTDVFSMGTILYEMLTGIKPFRGDTIPALFYNIVFRNPPSVRFWLPELPEAIEKVISRSLHKNPEQRFSSIDQFWYELIAALVEFPEASIKQPNGTAQSCVTAGDTPVRSNHLDIEDEVTQPRMQNSVASCKHRPQSTSCFVSRDRRSIKSIAFAPTVPAFHLLSSSHKGKPHLDKNSPTPLGDTPHLFENSPTPLGDTPHLFENSPNPLDDTPHLFENSSTFHEELRKTFEKLPITFKATSLRLGDTPSPIDIKGPVLIDTTLDRAPFSRAFPPRIAPRHDSQNNLENHQHSLPLESNTVNIPFVSQNENIDKKQLSEEQIATLEITPRDNSNDSSRKIHLSEEQIATLEITPRDNSNDSSRKIHRKHRRRDSTFSTMVGEVYSEKSQTLKTKRLKPRRIVTVLSLILFIIVVYLSHSLLFTKEHSIQKEQIKQSTNNFKNIETEFRPLNDNNEQPSSRTVRQIDQMIQGRRVSEIDGGVAARDSQTDLDASYASDAAPIPPAVSNESSKSQTVKKLRSLRGKRAKGKPRKKKRFFSHEKQNSSRLQSRSPRKRKRRINRPHRRAYKNK